ncbi:MAG: FtsX-like permease family protein [Methanobacterium sp.]|nr:FtsX-like permease family protein [Methanobacterium sp.]
MLDIAFKDFKAKKSRAIMCIIGVMACVLLIGVVNIVMYEMQSSLKGDLGTVNGKMFFEQNGTGYPPAGSIMSENLGDEVLQRSEVDASGSTKALFAPLQGGTTNDGGTPTMVVGLTPGKEQVFLADHPVEGKNSLVGEADNAVIMGSEAAKTYNVKVGDTFTVNDDKFKVVGIIKKVGKGWPLTIDNSVIMALPYAQSVTNRPDLISTVIIKPSADYSLQTVENNLQDSYGKYDIYTEKDVQKTIDNNLKGVMVFMNMVIAMIFAVSMVLIMNVMMMSVKEKTKEIGTMRAIGTKKRSIMALIIYESLILSLIGGVIGILLIAPTYNVLGIMMGSTSLNFSIPTTVVIQVALIVLVIGTFSGLIPAYLANRISPIEALRYE